MSRLLEIKDLTVAFSCDDKTITAVEKVSLEINGDETVILAGESGSGKTITSLSITKLLPRNAHIKEGQVLFEGKNLLRLEEKSLTKIRGKEIAYIFQEPTSYLNPVFTIGNQIIEALVMHRDISKKEARAAALELLSLVKMKDPVRVLSEYPHRLSGGMNQRAFIAMALACRPKLLIADEPTTSLDVTVEQEILTLLLGLKKQMGFSLLFITHNLSIAKKIADRICIMYRGNIVEQGTTNTIFTQPRHAHTKELIAAYEKIGRI